MMSFLVDLVSWTIWLAGLVAVTAAAASVLQFVRVHFVRSPTSFAVYGAGEQYWALVTGASDGIGKQYAIQLVCGVGVVCCFEYSVDVRVQAKRGFNVALLGRNEAKLNEVGQFDFTSVLFRNPGELTNPPCECSQRDFNQIQNHHFGFGLCFQSRFRCKRPHTFSCCNVAPLPG
jgi:hypothetical protein